jgi:hypothetical protein
LRRQHEVRGRSSRSPTRPDHASTTTARAWHAGRRSLGGRAAAIVNILSRAAGQLRTVHRRWRRGDRPHAAGGLRSQPDRTSSQRDRSRHDRQPIPDITPRWEANANCISQRLGRPRTSPDDGLLLRATAAARARPSRGRRLVVNGRSYEDERRGPPRRRRPSRPCDLVHQAHAVAPPSDDDTPVA